MKILRIIILVFAVFTILAGSVLAQTEPSSDGWPRKFENKGNTVIIYQPQLEEWTAYKSINARTAVSVKLKGEEQEHFGALYITADTETDFESREVLFKNFQYTDMVFPNADDVQAAVYRKAVTDVLPEKKFMVISLDRVMAGLDRAKVHARTVEVNIEPPPIYYSDKPARLVIFNGEPRFEAIKGAPKLLYALNTNWDILLELGSARYYMLDGESWLVTKDLEKGPWKVAGKLPGAFNKLPDDDNWKEVKSNIPGTRAKHVPQVFVSKMPAELIVTDGKPTYISIEGTNLLYATNTESDIFFHSGDKYIYFLTAGRWFKTKSLTNNGKWSAASMDLPGDFHDIPVTHEKAHVLSAVPDTPEAEVATLLATIPRKATVDRNDTTIEVPYEGEPEFVEIEETETVYYAVNTPYNVFRVNDMYYSVHDGVWFESYIASGPWVVSISVPAVIYTIPPTHPKHNVTYVHVYDYTPSTVVVGYTSGYSGAYISSTGVLMFGLGWWLAYDLLFPHFHHYHYHPHYYSYGSSHRYNYYYGGYYRAARYYGPYGGAGGWAWYHPRKKRHYRGGFSHGPYGKAYARQAYNPYTKRRGTRRRAYNLYSAWGKSVIAEGDKWSGTGRRSRKTKAAKRTSRDYTRKGQGVVVRKDKHGDVYVGRRGGVYKRSNEGWQKKTGSGWKRVEAASVPSRDDSGDKSGGKRTRRPSVDSSGYTSGGRKTGKQPSGYDSRYKSGGKKAKQPSGDRQYKSSSQEYKKVNKQAAGGETRKKTRKEISREESKSNTVNNLNSDYKARSRGNQRSRTFNQGSTFNQKRNSERGGDFPGGSKSRR